MNRNSLWNNFDSIYIEQSISKRKMMITSMIIYPLKSILVYKYIECLTTRDCMLWYIYISQVEYTYIWLNRTKLHHSSFSLILFVWSSFICSLFNCYDGRWQQNDQIGIGQWMSGSSPMFAIETMVKSNVVFVYSTLYTFSSYNEIKQMKDE